jgi:hypothetical protein
MAASKYDFSIEQGTSFKISLIYKNSEGNPINLTNWCARLIWKTNNGTTQTFSTDNLDYSVYKFILDEVAGKLTLLIPADTTNSFNFTTAKYDLELQSPDDLYDGGGKYTTRLLFGTINLVKRNSQSSIALDCNHE